VSRAVSRSPRMRAVDRAVERMAPVAVAVPEGAPVRRTVGVHGPVDAPASRLPEWATEEMTAIGARYDEASRALNAMAMSDAGMPFAEEQAARLQIIRAAKVARDAVLARVASERGAA